MLATVAFFYRGWRINHRESSKKHNLKGRQDDETFSDNALASLEIKNSYFQLLTMNAKFSGQHNQTFICNSQHYEETIRKLCGLYKGDQSQISALSALQRINHRPQLISSQLASASSARDLDHKLDCSNVHCGNECNVKPTLLPSRGDGCAQSDYERYVGSVGIQTDT